jgi:hypothetical protein
MVRLAQEGILVADLGAPPAEVRVDESARQGHYPAQDPRPQDERGRVH